MKKAYQACPKCGGTRYEIAEPHPPPGRCWQMQRLETHASAGMANGCRFITFQIVQLQLCAKAMRADMIASC